MADKTTGKVTRNFGVSGFFSPRKTNRIFVFTLPNYNSVQAGLVRLYLLEKLYRIIPMIPKLIRVHTVPVVSADIASQQDEMRFIAAHGSSSTGRRCLRLFVCLFFFLATSILESRGSRLGQVQTPIFSWAELMIIKFDLCSTLKRHRFRRRTFGRSLWQCC